MIDTKKIPLIVLSGVIIAIVVISILYVLNANRDNAVTPEVNQVADIPQEPKSETVQKEESTEQPLPGDTTVLNGTEKYPAGTFEGMTVQEKINYMSKDQVSIPGDATFIEGAEKYPAGTFERMTTQEKIDYMNKKIDQQNKEDGVIILEGSDMQTSP